MSGVINLEWDSSQLTIFRDSGVEKALQRALSKAGGDALRTMRAEASRGVRARKRFKVKAVNESLPLVFPKTKEIQGLIWQMGVSGKPVSLADLPHRQTKKGVKVAVNKGAWKLIPSAFVAKMKSGHEAVFIRARSAMQGPLTQRQAKLKHVFRVGRLPIEQLATTSVANVFADAGFIPTLQAKAQEKFTTTFNRLLPLELDKLK
jgi:hypothetical protein